MQKFYQTEWQGIQFDEITEVSDKELASSKFYNDFYRELFRRYQSYNELELGWRERKEELADWIGGRIEKGVKVLSIGCGLGYIENHLHKKYAEKFELHVSDFASESLKWLQAVLPPDNVHILTNKESFIAGKYDYIYLSAVDYAMSTQEVIALLNQMRSILAEGGTCLLISASFIENDGISHRLKTGFKQLLKKNLAACGLYKIKQGQFWGWMRNRAEYRALIMQSNFSSYVDGFLATEKQHTYFIEAKK